MGKPRKDQDGNQYDLPPGQAVHGYSLLHHGWNDTSLESLDAQMSLSLSLSMDSSQSVLMILPCLPTPIRHTAEIAPTSQHNDRKVLYKTPLPLLPPITNQLLMSTIIP